jgi:hypothetical protein
VQYQKNGSIALLWKEQDAKKKKDINIPSADDHILDPHSVGAFKAVGLMPTETNIIGKVRKIIKVNRSAFETYYRRFDRQLE